MASVTYRLGEFRLDPAARELWRGDEEVPLHRKAFDCVVYLIEHRDRAVARDELFAAVWGDIELSDGVLGQSILEARRALDDTGEDQHVIKTVRAFGYRWVAPVEAVEPQEQTAMASTVTGVGTASRRRSTWVRALLAILALTALVSLPSLLRRRDEPHSPEAPRTPRGAGEITLLLPAAVDADSDHAWLRLGLMDLIARRLHTAGQAMVPSDTVIQLLHEPSARPGEDELRHLAESTGAHLVLVARAQARGTRWTVSLHSLLGAQPPLTAVGEAHDVLAAARAAADRLAVDLGLTPVPGPDAKPALQMLLQRIEAAKLAQQMDVVQELIEGAEPELRTHPEVRRQQASVHFHSYELTAARSELEALLSEALGGNDPVYRARIQNALAAVYASQGDVDRAERLMKEATRSLEGRDMPEMLGKIRMNLAGVAIERRDFAAARRELALARMLCQSIGDVRQLAILDTNVGVLEALQENFAEARRYFRSAVERHVAVHDIGGELLSRANLIETHLMLLDSHAASDIEPGLNELLARTDNPELFVIVTLNRISLQHALGRSREASTLLDEVLTVTAARPELHRYHMAALAELAEKMQGDGNAVQAADLARQVVEGLASDESPMVDETRSRGWLTLVRTALARGDHAGAAEAAAALAEWADRIDARSAQIRAALARAEVAATVDGPEEAEAAFEHAVRLAAETRVPKRLLQVAPSYVRWLLDEGAHGGADPQRAAALTDRLGAYADQDFSVALLHLRVYRALGSASAWRIAVGRATSLAGDRRIPAELLEAPRLR